MKRFHIKVDPNLSFETKAFGARAENDSILIPSKLAQVLERFSLGDDAVTIAGYLAAFPTSVAGALGLSPGAAIAAAESFIKLIEDSGADVSSIRRPIRRRPLGAKHPREMNQRRDHLPV